MEALIPFNSEIKFNAFIRDMDPEKKQPGNAADNQCIFLKGAPERILSRCNKILIDGEEVEFTQELKDEVDGANKKFGGMGERVLAFARLHLDPEVFTKNPPYPFDVKKWKDWPKDSLFENNSDVPGWFPMYNLTLVGVVSLNDPPRVLVDQSVLKCRAAGIKVIMVTGDQPPTAAAIAHKVNIIIDPEQEYNRLMEKGMSQAEAFSASNAIVVHGDELAAKHVQ